MLIRVASYFGKNEMENFFGASLGDFEPPEPHYNLSPGHELVAVTGKPNAKDISVSRYRWGGEPANSGSHFGPIADVPAVKEQLSRQRATPCVVPVSGFYMWKNDDEKDQPFFVRMMKLPFMPMAAILNNGAFQLILTKANTLVEPMSPVMPLVLNSALAQDWLQKSVDITELAEKAYKTFFITDFTVLKVSKKVSDPSSNTPALIQPLPK